MKHDTEPTAVRHADHVLQFLQYGRDNAIVGRDLRAKTGLPDRVLRKTLEGIRRGGQVVISGDTGYFIPATLEELQGYIKQEEHRARSTFFTLQSARQLAEKMQAQGEQLRMEGSGM